MVPKFPTVAITSKILFSNVLKTCIKKDFMGLGRKIMTTVDNMIMKATRKLV